jgi:hypothetical protein
MVSTKIRRVRSIPWLLAAVLMSPAPAAAWGFEAHKFIADRAIDLLPPELKPIFEKRRAFVVERAIDPDLWRLSGWQEEDPNHFLDLDNEAFGPYPFGGLPRDYDAAVQKFGKEFIQENGTVPWRVQEFYGRLQRAFESLNRQPSGFAGDNVVYYSAILAHYVADAHVPLHAVVNYDGQLTMQNGVHSRWESELFERSRSRLKVMPSAPKPVVNPRDFIFDTVLASNRLSQGVFEADKAAANGREFYDDEYFTAFERSAFPVLQQRVNESITAVASVIIGAWQQAGKPNVPTEPSRTPRRIRRPNP